MSKRVLQCRICFDYIELKQIDLSTELDCGHIFHNKCVKEWCNNCVNNDNKPNCPLCRKVISGEYLEILGIVQNIDKQFDSILNTFNLLEYIIKNRLYMDIDKLNKIKENYPDEFKNIYFILRSCY